MLQKATNLFPQVQFDTPNEDIYRLSALRWRVAAPESFVTTYAGWSISEDFAETARDSALLWLAQVEDQSALAEGDDDRVGAAATGAPGQGHGAAIVSLIGGLR
jgi:hypothetical protein